MDILDLIKTRRSIRRFEDRKTPDEIIEKMLEAGRWAPSGLNNQPWRFAIVTDPVLKDNFSGLTHYAKIIKGADLLIPVFLDNAKSYHREKDILAAGACIQNMLLEAHSLGLGVVWLGEILKSSRQINELLGLAENFELMAVLAIGWPAEDPKATSRKALDELIIFRR